jgi:uncharacterized BrkB/YihY/UPF0761 family membrane protein
VVPGPAGYVLTTAITHAHRVASHHRLTALGLGSIGALVTATTAMGQVERGVNRLYGIERDRSVFMKYSRAFVLALSVGSLMILAAGCLAFGHFLLVKSHHTTPPGA